MVVYKVDRLTRSLADFAKLVELFDQYGVSFVSITQSFNTTSSMGRLTLNVLLSFAQFEREVIGERVRDKIAASKRKGLWVGGPVPLGYRCIDKKLEIVPEEAETVRTIFSLYLELGSMGALIAELDRRGIRTKVNGRRDGRQSGGIRFGVGPLAHLLKNRFYIGEVTYRGEVHRGEHEPILSRDLFEAVQEKLAANAVARQIRLRGSAALLTGRLFDDRGNRMSPTHANKKGARYRYYVSQALLQNRKAEAGSIARVPAPETEKLVCDGVRRHLAAMGKEPSTTCRRELIERHVARVMVKPQTLDIGLLPTSGTSAQTEGPGLPDPAPTSLPTTTITLPWTAPSFAAVKGILHTPSRKAGDETRKPRRSAHRHCQGPGMDRRHPARPHCLLRRNCRARGPGRTAHPPARSPRLPVAPHHRGDRRRHRTYGSHGHRSRQSPAPFLGRARAGDLAEHLGPRTRGD